MRSPDALQLPSIILTPSTPARPVDTPPLRGQRQRPGLLAFQLPRLVVLDRSHAAVGVHRGSLSVLAGADTVSPLRGWAAMNSRSQARGAEPLSGAGCGGSSSEQRSAGWETAHAQRRA